ncbi:uncharacterized protein HKW66_Vig0029390 [Vigna angularis]|uniref:Uncharacterized protein n=1 Tax=Phaseolus angularis TaxID=3914 RepID=A0A8T0L7H7_PHAAN|nr:uncharacterized protein HKW66_Vig0029390 [Vigna angularis]
MQTREQMLLGALRDIFSIERHSSSSVGVGARYLSQFSAAITAAEYAPCTDPWLSKLTASPPKNRLPKGAGKACHKHQLVFQLNHMSNIQESLDLFPFEKPDTEPAQKLLETSS